MTPIGHVMILASAGSGKTYALTNRFVKLLALGAAPERIVALTFTRKAAGEFFDEILKKLARAATDESYARQLSQEIGVEVSSRTAPGESIARRGSAQRSAYSDFLTLLRSMVDAMHRLQLGTLDGFFARIARNFPLELGLTGEFTILQEHTARVERTRVLRRMFERRGELGDEQREFIEAFKRATFGAEEKRLGAQLDTFLDEHQEIYLGARSPEVWANADRIWPNGSQWLGGTGNTQAALETLQRWATSAPLGDKQRARWLDFLKAWKEWSPGTTPPRVLVYVLEKALDSWRALGEGTAILEFDRKKQELTPAASAALVELTRYVVGGEIARRIEMTQGIYAVLHGYESVYQTAVRRGGKLTFGDVQRLLMPEHGAPVLTSGQMNSRAEEDNESRDANRLLIDYRLDATVDHWLLDEFQDTSFGQWSILRNLIDEVVQDPTGARSFFYVGDVKQAIFAWREGDPRLFREIFDFYNSARPGAIAEEHLVASWRSGLPIIATVNRVFGDATVLRELFPGTASEIWNREWRTHESARPELIGQAALLHAETETERFATALAVLQDIEPLEHGLTCALLVQDNATATRLADYLRQEGGLPAMAESDLHVCTDNPLGAALLSLATVAAHPGDSLAWEHVGMTPVGKILAQTGIHSREDLTAELLTRIHREGFESAMRHWSQALLQELAPDDAFSRLRARQFTAAAGLFDATGSRDVAEFVQFMQRHVVRDVDAPDVLRVMTIHKSKGLGFDVVLLPDLEGLKLDCRREGLAVQKAADRTVEWVLDLPAKIFQQHDDVLAAHVRAAEASGCYESLSLLYVAMTRAKRAMYLIVKPPGSSSSRNYSKLLAETLGEEVIPVKVGSREYAGSWSEGESTWWRQIAEIPKQAPFSLNLERISEASPTTRLLRRRPSESSLAEFSAAQLFTPERHEAAEFGISVHRLLADVEWVSDSMNLRIADAWREERIPSSAIAETLACLREPTLAHVWNKEASLTRRRVLTGHESTAGCDVWRERSFEVAFEGLWLTGVFDRVIIYRDGTGQPMAADVLDFKTDRIKTGENLAAAVSRHSAQLNLYRKVAATLTHLPITAISCYLIFTRSRQIIEVPRDADVSSA